jgi:hypothetical protein
MDSAFTLLEPWEKLVPGQADAFLRELQIELSPSHPLHGLNLTPVAHSARADDALFQLADGRVVEVHLTWIGKTEQPPAPPNQIYSSFQEWVQQVMIRAQDERSLR